MFELDLFNRDKNHTFSQVVGDGPSPWVPSAPAVEVEGDTLNYTQRSTLKWEKEEALGEMATVAPVLYTNTNFPNLKEDFPGNANQHIIFLEIINKLQQLET